MDSMLFRLKTTLMMKNRTQRLGAWMMLFSTLSFFNIITWLPWLQFQLYFSIEFFLVGAVMSHGIQKTTYLWVKNLGLNFYIIGWASVVHGIFVANTYLGLYTTGVLGVYIVFLGIVMYFMHDENPTRDFIQSHLLVGLLLTFVGTITFLLVYSETEINLLNLIRIKRLPALWCDKAIVAVLVGVGLILIRLFLHFFSQA